MMKSLFLCIPFVVLLSCASNGREPQPDLSVQALPPPVEAVEPEASIAPSAPQTEEAAVFDPLTITAEEKETAMEEMRILVAKINQVIRAKDYQGWVSYLADDFIAAINSPAYLAQVSESSRLLKSQNIILKTSRDYFTHVVVASRANVVVDASLDDIEFLSHTRVKAFTVNDRKQRLRLFEFVKAGGAWKIAFSS
jgi:hypothetical protein